MKFLTTAQAAEVLGVTAARVRQLVYAGKLPAEQIGRDLLVDSMSVGKFQRPKRGRPKKQTEYLYKI